MKRQNSNIPSWRRTSRWRNGLLGLAAALFMAPAANAQVTNYSFATGSDPYAALVAPTTFSINGGGGTADDGYSALQPIGFSFNFGGTSFTDFSMHSNGWLRFGATASVTDYSPMDNGTMNNLVVFNGRDLNNAGAVYSYLLTGSPGSYICKIEAKNFYRYSTATHLGQAQVWLYQATGVIEIRYGAYAATWTSGTAQVGIRTTNTDVRKVVSATWAGVTGASTDGVGNTAGITQGTTNQVVSGTLFTFTPPVVCTGTPDPGTVPSSASACSGNTVTLTATGLTVGTNISYQWEESPDGIGSWADVVVGSGGTTASYTTDAITGTRYFRIRTDCSTGPNSNNSNVATVSVTAGGIAEDFSSGTIIGNCWAQSGTGAAVNLRYVTTSAYGTGTGSIMWDYYTQNGLTLIYTSPVITPIGSGVQLQFDVAAPQYNLTTIDSIYIEESSDGGSNWTLVNAGSNEVGSTFNTLPLSTAEYNIPANGDWQPRSFPLTAGTNRVRFRGVSDYGNNIHVDNIALGVAPTCQAPTAVDASNLTTASADIAWTCTSCTGTFIVEYGVAPFAPGTDGTAGGGTIWTGSPVAGSPVTITGLSAQTNYAVYVREVCPGPDYSPNSTVENFTTPCAALNVPYTQDFETAVAPAFPNCTSVENVNGSNTWVTGSSNYFGPTTTVAAYPWNGVTAADDWFYSAGINLVGGTEYTLSYDYGANGYDEALEVYYGTSATSGGMTEEVVDHGIFFDGPYSVSYSVTPAVTGVYYFGWHAYSAADQFNLFLDNISLIEAPPCPIPSGVSVSGTTFNSTNVNFTCSGCTGDVIVEYGPAGYTPGTAGTAGVGGTLVSGAATSPEAIGGLMQGTSYDVYVRQDCSVALDGYSNNSALVNFTTPIQPPANDECANAIPLDCNTLVTGTTVNATLEVPAPAFCGTGLTAPGVWYTVAGFDGAMFATLCGSTAYDSKINVYTGSCGAWVCVGGNDDNFSCTSNTASSRLDWTGSSANTYYILVQGFSSATGAFDLFVGCGDTNPACAANGLNLEFQNDGNPGEVSYEVLDETGSVIVLSGADPVAANGIGTQALCLPDGCYRLRVLDSGGDGMTTGGYELRETGANGRRIIDNTNNFSNGGVSAISGGGTFCLPIGDVDLIFSSCDKMDWVNYKYMVCHADAQVAAEWVPNGPNGVQDANSGYEFWVFDPNGTYSFRKFHPHNQSQGFSPASANRACRFKINDGYNTVLNPWIPQGVKMNVRVRGRVNGSNMAFGPACTMMLDAAAAACPIAKLQDDPSNTNDFSCGVTRQFGGTNTGANKIVARPPQFEPAPYGGGTGVRFQFRFRIPAEGVCIVRPPQASATMYLNWSAASGPQLLATKTYEVEVRVSKDLGATWCIDTPSPACDPSPVTSWGKACNVTISSVVPLTGGSTNMTTVTDGALTMYPNPNNGDQLTISLTEVASDVRTVSVDIYDLAGKRVSARTIAVSDGFVKTNIDLHDELANGLYMVNITAGEKTYNERLVIQK